MAKRDYYEILGVARDADEDDIKRAYRKLAIKLHPDRNPDDPHAEEAFKEASEAFSVLSDRDKRRRYDQVGHAAFERAGGAGFEQVDLGAIGEMFEGLIGDVFRVSRKGGGARPPKDMRYQLDLNLEEAARGVEKQIEIERRVRCKHCGGKGAEPNTPVDECPACGGRGEMRFQRGFFSASRPCSACDGSGSRITTPCSRCKGQAAVKRKETMRVRVPAGVEDGAIRTIRGGGEETPRGAGDLHVEVRLRPHDLLRREGADLRCEVPVSFPQAALGDTVEVPALEGKLRVKVPPGTQPGTVLRLRGKGFPVFGGYGKGDQLVTVALEVPERLSDRQRSLIEELHQEMDLEAHPQQRSFLERLRTWLS